MKKCRVCKGEFKSKFGLKVHVANFSDKAHTELAKELRSN
jgi:hypothetical protein